MTSKKSATSSSTKSSFFSQVSEHQRLDLSSYENLRARLARQIPRWGQSPLRGVIWYNSEYSRRFRPFEGSQLQGSPKGFYLALGQCGEIGQGRKNVRTEKYPSPSE